MDTISKLLSDPAWWFTAIFIAIVINLLSTYLRDFIDRIFSKLSRKYRLRTIKKDKEGEQLAVHLANDPTMLVMYSVTMVYYMVFGVGELIAIVHFALMSNSAFTVYRLQGKLIDFLAFLFYSGWVLVLAILLTYQVNLVARRMRVQREALRHYDEKKCGSGTEQGKALE